MFDDMFEPKKKKAEISQKMDPSHPRWESALEEVSTMLLQADRIFDRETVIAIAMDDDAYYELASEASENMVFHSQLLKKDRMAKTIKGARDQG